MKTLIIAEKPSVAGDLSKVLAKNLGSFNKKGKSRDSQYYESDQAIITSAVGHLVELKMPTTTEGKNLPWKFDVLPAIPKAFELQPIETTKARLKHVLSLAKKREVSLIVNACDAGREGELIFQYIMEVGAIKKTTKRLWMRSMTPSAILDAWGQLREGIDMNPLRDAAKCRSESDWLVGLNSTRALTCYRSRHGSFNMTAAGRVQTPTLAILAKREREIMAFKSKPYYEVQADFSVAAGSYLGNWVDLLWKKNPQDPHSRPERIWEEEKATKIKDRCQGKTGTVTEKTKPQKQVSPQLYDLTTLQREAPFTAKQTLNIAQALYEKHKMLTYPRTDSRYLPEDYVSKVVQTTKEFANSDHPLAKYAKESIQKNQIRFNKRIFNNAKVSDHFAIIPTGRRVKLNDAEAKVYDMVLKRFLAVFFPAAEFELTTRLTTIDHQSEVDTFRTTGKVLVNPGWLSVYGREKGVAASKDELVPVTQNEEATVENLEQLSKQTNPPARYTESTLLSAMEGAGKLVDDDELREAMSERGLGTPATRAATIEGLISQKYIARDGRDLNVSGKGLSLIELLEEMDIQPLTSPSMTGDWEAKLRHMEKGKLDRKTFMTEIITFTEEVVTKAKKHLISITDKKYPNIPARCPECEQTHLKQTDGTYECEQSECTFKINKHIAGRGFSDSEAVEFINNKKLETRDGFMSRFNKPFEAGLELIRPVSKTGKLGKWKTNFVFENDENEDADSIDFTEDMKVGECKLNGQKLVKIYQTEKAYFVPSMEVKGEDNGLRMGKMILQQPLAPQDILELIEKGKTKVLDKFISKRTKRAFSAHLTMNFTTGKIGFEFPPRPAKKAKKKKASD